MAESDLKTVYSCYALFLFSPQVVSQYPEVVDAWVNRAASQPAEREIALKRIDMILAHDVLSRLGSIRHPALVVCGDRDFCAPLHLSEEIAAAIHGAELEVLRGAGHSVHQEQPEQYYEKIRAFIRRH